MAKPKIQFKPYQVAKNRWGNFPYTLSGIRSEKKTRIKVQVKDTKLRLFKNLFLRFISKHLCRCLKSNVIKSPVSRRTTFHVVEA